MRNMECLILAEGVSKSYNGIKVLEEASMCVPKGISVLWAPNGSGKTTLIKIMLGLIKPDKGRVQLNVPRHKTGVLLESSPPPPLLTVQDLLEWAASLKGCNLDTKDFIILLEEMGLSPRTMHLKIRELSSGMLKRVMIAQAMIGEPRLLVLDEPFSYLDYEGRIHVSLLLNKLALTRGILVSTHILSLLNPRSIYTIVNGNLIGPLPVDVTRRTITAFSKDSWSQVELSVNDVIKNRVNIEKYLFLDT